MTKLTPFVVQQIKKEWSEGRSLKEIARKHRIGITSVVNAKGDTPKGDPLGQKVIEMFKAGKSLVEIADFMKVGRIWTVTEFLRRRGFDPKNVTKADWVARCLKAEARVRELEDEVADYRARTEPSRVCFVSNR